MNAKLADILERSERAVFFGGAGVSTESGIPDFRSENGLYAALQTYGRPPEELLSHSFFMRHPEQFYQYYRDHLIHAEAKPNPAHIALAKLEERGKLFAVITQNIDGLHQTAGSKNVFELHGSVHRNYCIDCGAKYPLECVMAAEGIPRCTSCNGRHVPADKLAADLAGTGTADARRPSTGRHPTIHGLVRPDVVLYEESLNDEVVAGAVEAIQNADTLIVGGTSLVVYPAAGLLQYFGGQNLVLINRTQTPYDSRAQLIIREPIGEAMRIDDI